MDKLIAFEKNTEPKEEVWINVARVTHVDARDENLSKIYVAGSAEPIYVRGSAATIANKINLALRSPI